MLWQLLSEKMARGTKHTNQPTKDWQDLKEWNIYLSCDKLPYAVFKECCVTNDYSTLSISGGYVPRETLERAWLQLYSEYCEISGDEAVKAQVQDMAHLAVLESRIFRTKLAVRELYKYHSEIWCNVLRDLGYKYKFTRESLAEDLDTVLRRLKNLERDAQALVLSLNKNNSDDATITYAHFDNQLIIMQEAFKFFIDANSITAQQYGLYVKRLKEMARKNEEGQDGGTD